MDGTSVFEGVAADTADDGTQPEDLAIYLRGLARYRTWFMKETPARYLGRLERILQALEEDLAALDRLLAVPEDDFLADPAYRDQALWRLFHALVAFLEVSKWLLARETAKGDRPRSFSEAFAWLAEKGVLPLERCDEYRALCRLRNRFAHSMDESPPPAAARAMVQHWLPELRAAAAHLRARYLG